MSLLNEAMTDCTMMICTTTPDGYGGHVEQWEDGEEFTAAIVFDTSMQARVADKEGVSSRYTITTAKDKVMSFHDVFRREEDGKIFRVTSDGDDKYTPDSASLNMRQVTAEEYEVESEDGQATSNP